MFMNFPWQTVKLLECNQFLLKHFFCLHSSHRPFWPWSIHRGIGTCSCHGGASAFDCTANPTACVQKLWRFTPPKSSRLCQVVPSMGFVIPPSAPDMKSALKLPLIIVGLYVMAAKMTAPKPYRGPGAKKGRFSSTFLKGTMEGK